MGRPTIAAGRLPQQRGEIALDHRFARGRGIEVGARVVCATSSGSREMVVSGLVDSPYYIGLDRGSSRVGAGSSQGFDMPLATISHRWPRGCPWLRF